MAKAVALPVGVVVSVLLALCWRLGQAENRQAAWRQLGVSLGLLALVAAPPSPEKPRIPFPATVVMNPVAASTRRMRWLARSAMKRLPEASTATPLGNLRLASVAGPPWPRPSPPPPTVALTPVDASPRRRRSLSLSAMNSLP